MSSNIITMSLNHIVEESPLSTLDLAGNTMTLRLLQNESALGTDSTGKIIAGSAPTPPQAPFGYIFGMNLIYVDGTHLVINEGAIVVQGLLYQIVDSVGIDLGIVGAGGLDTGTLATNTWYYVYFIANSTNTSSYNLICSTNSSAPDIPAGFDVSRYIGSIKTDSVVAQMIDFRQNGNGNTRTYFWFFQDSNNTQLILSDGVSNFLDAIPYVGGAPVRLDPSTSTHTTSSLLLGLSVLIPVVTGDDYLYVTNSTSSGIPFFSEVTTQVGNATSTATMVLPLATTTIAYKVSAGANASIYVNGYTEEI